MNNKKVLNIVLIFLFVLSLAGGTIGFFQNQKVKAPTKESKIEYNVNLAYYLNGTLVDIKPDNEIIGSSMEESTSTISYERADTYTFEKYECTNNVIGNWDESTWTFTPNKTANATCSLYFLSKYVTIEINPTNGTSEKVESNKIERGNDYSLKIQPTTGYEYSEAKCSNNEEVVWDEKTSKIIVKSVSNNTICNIDFAIKKFTAEIKVNNGSGEITIPDKEYGSEISTAVTASNGYVYSTKPSCTNSQSATWSEGTLTIAKLTDNTVCTVNFTAQVEEIKKYKVTINIQEHGHISNSNARTDSATVESGGTAYFTVDPDEGYKISGTTCSNASVDAGIVTITNITSDQTCTINISTRN